MRDGPDLELQKAIYSVLTSDENVVAIVGEAVFDQVPNLETRDASGAIVNPDIGEAYLVLGPDSEAPDISDGIDGSDWLLNIHGYTRSGGFAASKQLAAAVRRALHDVRMNMDGTHLIVMWRAGVTYLSEPDGVTRHCVCRFRALTEPR